MYSYSVQSLTLLLKTVPFLPGQDEGVLELVAEVVAVTEVPDGGSLVELEFANTSGVVVELASGSPDEEVAEVVELAREVVDEASGTEVVEDAPTSLEVRVALLPQSSQLENGDVVGRSDVLILVEEVTVTFTVSTPAVTVLYEVVVLKPSIVLV